MSCDISHGASWSRGYSLGAADVERAGAKNLARVQTRVWTLAKFSAPARFTSAAPKEYPRDQLAPCEISQDIYDKGFSAIEKSHQRTIMELRRTHRQELDRIRQEKDQLLQEEARATQAGRLNYISVSVSVFSR